MSKQVNPLCLRGRVSHSATRKRLQGLNDLCFDKGSSVASLALQGPNTFVGCAGGEENDISDPH